MISGKLYWEQILHTHKNPSTLGFYIKIFSLKYICLFLEVLKLSGSMGRHCSSVISLAEVKLSLELSKKLALALSDI